MIRSLSNDAVHALLSPENSIVYRVPKYQREYSWGRDQWDELIDDLLDQPNNDGHFLGTIICVNNTENTTSESVLEVIDGQQRLTTISLLLAAIYAIVNERAEDLDDDDRNDLANLRRMLVLRNPIRSRVRPQSQNENADDFNHVLALAGLGVEDPGARYAGVRRVKKGFNHFKARIRDVSEQTGEPVDKVALDLLSRVKRANIVKLEVNTHADAFTLFESLNNRGMPLTPIDLIKNTLLGRADQQGGGALDRAYEEWRGWLQTLGDDYSTQERFFRYFYNAMHDEFDLEVPGAHEARKSNLIRIYETLIDRDAERLQNVISLGVEAFAKLIGNSDEVLDARVAAALQRLRRAQGSPAQVLLLYLLVTQDEIELSDSELVDITDLLTAFFVRRNLTGIPATNMATRLFQSLVVELREISFSERKQHILDRLLQVSASEEAFMNVLTGPVYDLNTDLVRFILVSLAERAMTAETMQDLWRREPNESKPRYRWSIEHILPQGENLPAGWVDMLGGVAAAEKARKQYAHHLGNLTITGYNSSLGNRSFPEKRDHCDANGNYIGYKNGLSLNAALAKRETWNVESILSRTQDLAAQTAALFPLAYRS